jgi:hypothetical protein
LLKVFVIGKYTKILEWGAFLEGVYFPGLVFHGGERWIFQPDLKNDQILN